MNIDTYEDGAPSWIDLDTTDLAAATRFYGELFGWAQRPGAPGAKAGTTWLLRGRPVAAVTSTTGAIGSRWTTYVNVADGDKTVEKVTASGGSVLEAAADFSVAGRSAVLADPAGTRFALWQAGEHHGAGIVGEPGSFSWGELITDDVDTSEAFYGAVFGWTLTVPEGPLGRREWQLGGRSISGLLPRPPAMPAEIPPYWDVYFAVADTPAVVDAAARLGGTTLMPATAIEHGTIAVFADPTGAVFTVSGPAR
jgi:uncharacterized protein